MVAFSCLAVLLLAQSSARGAETGFSGMYLQGVNERIGEALGLDKAEGVLIRDIAIGEPAARAGLRRGDLITDFDGRKIHTFDDLLKIAARTKPDQDITVNVLRQQKPVSLTLKMGRRTGGWTVKKGEVATIPETGLTLAAITPKIRNRFKIRWGALGVLVSLVDPDRALQMPLSRGDIIVQVDQQEVWAPGQILDLYRHARKNGRERMLILVERMGEFQFMLLPVKHTF